TALDLKVNANASIVSATKTKITYDSKGLVTSGADLIESDIPTLSQSKITNLVSDLASKIALTEKGAANGVATLGADSKIPTSQLPA
ncbi:hypothetical protein ACS2TD_27185, partial [Bacillus cereus group sp. BC334]